METHFTLAQLADPRLKEADEILRRCVHCGFCSGTCPSYQLLGDERDSPRGRILLIKSMLEGELAPRQVRPHLDTCLSCNACMTTCPSGVDYMHLSDYARGIIETSSTRSPDDALIRKLLAAILPYPRRFRLAARFGQLARPLQKLLKLVGFKVFSAMLGLAPRTKLGRGQYHSPQVIRTKRLRRGRVVLMMGCAQKVLRPEINDASVRVLNYFGYDVVIAPDEGCCGALVHHMGKEAQAQSFARANIDAWHVLREQGPLDAIIINASGCGSTVKDYGHMLAGDPAYAEKAKYISSLAKDISEFLAGQKLEAPRGWSDIRVAYHSACSLQHYQKVNAEPRTMLANAGFTVVEIAEGHLCCGSAGVFNLLQSEMAQALKTRKLTAIEQVRPDCVASGNIGCIMQLAGAVAPVVHTVELLDWAYGGPCPKALRKLQARVRPMPSAETGRQESEFV